MQLSTLPISFPWVEKDEHFSRNYKTAYTAPLPRHNDFFSGFQNKLKEKREKFWGPSFNVQSTRRLGL